MYLDQVRYTWPHNSALKFLTTSFQALNGSSLYADLPGFLSPSIITEDQLRPDLLLKTKENCLYVVELAIGFEKNFNCNANRKSEKYATLISVNLSISLLHSWQKIAETFEQKRNSRAMSS